MKKNSLTKLNKHAVAMISLLVVQYLVGMLTNLYIHFPEGESVAHQWKFASGQWLVMLHVIVGTLLVFGVMALYVQAIKMKDKTWKIAGGIASGSVILAFICGEEFVSRQSDMYSFAMSLFFIVALGAICWGIYKARA